MSPKPVQAARFSLRRWSQRKLAVGRKPTTVPSAASTPPAAGATPPADTSVGPRQSVVSETPPAAAATATELPPVESLTFDSEFAQFLKPDVDETIKRAALRKLLRDPRFNVMDGLDTYIDDYTKADPIPADMLKQLVQARYIFDPPKTETTAEGHVIDSPVKNDSGEPPEAIAAPVDSPNTHPQDGATSTGGPDGAKQ
jgi:Protein of unknown function (DUF3306)